MRQKWFFAGILLILLGACGFGIFKWTQKKQLTSNFKLHDSNPVARQYLAHEHMEEMDLQLISNTAFNYARTTEGRPMIEVDLPCDVCYYKDENLKEQAFVLKKGTRIPFKVFESSQDDLGRGIFSLPTHQKGIRYVRPFPDTVDDDTAENWYYVKISELMKVSRAMAESPGFVPGWYAGGSKELFIRHEVLYVDCIFYLRGMFLSSDLTFKDIKPFLSLKQ